METAIWLLVAAVIIVGGYVVYKSMTKTSEPAQMPAAEPDNYKETPAQAAIDPLVEPKPASVVSLETQRRDAQSELDEGLDDTFPASDPPSVTSPNTTGGPSQRG